MRRLVQCVGLLLCLMLSGQASLTTLADHYADAYTAMAECQKERSRNIDTARTLCDFAHLRHKQAVGELASLEPKKKEIWRGYLQALGAEIKALRETIQASRSSVRITSRVGIPEFSQVNVQNVRATSPAGLALFSVTFPADLPAEDLAEIGRIVLPPHEGKVFDFFDVQLAVAAEPAASRQQREAVCSALIDQMAAAADWPGVGFSVVAGDGEGAKGDCEITLVPYWLTGDRVLVDVPEDSDELQEILDGFTADRWPHALESVTIWTRVLGEGNAGARQDLEQRCAEQTAAGLMARGLDGFEIDWTAGPSTLSSPGPLQCLVELDAWTRIKDGVFVSEQRPALIERLQKLNTPRLDRVSLRAKPVGEIEPEACNEQSAGILREAGISPLLVGRQYAYWPLELTPRWGSVPTCLFVLSSSENEHTRWLTVDRAGDLTDSDELGGVVDWIKADPGQRIHRLSVRFIETGGDQASRRRARSRRCFRSVYQAILKEGVHPLRLTIAPEPEVYTEQHVPYADDRCVVSITLVQDAPTRIYLTSGGQVFNKRNQALVEEFGIAAQEPHVRRLWIRGLAQPEDQTDLETAAAYAGQLRETLIALGAPPIKISVEPAERLEAPLTQALWAPEFAVRVELETYEDGTEALGLVVQPGAEAPVSGAIMERFARSDLIDLVAFADGVGTVWSLRLDAARCLGAVREALVAGGISPARIRGYVEGVGAPPWTGERLGGHPPQCFVELEERSMWRHSAAFPLGEAPSGVALAELRDEWRLPRMVAEVFVVGRVADPQAAARGCWEALDEALEGEGPVILPLEPDAPSPSAGEWPGPPHCLIAVNYEARGRAWEPGARLPPPPDEGEFAAWLVYETADATCSSELQDELSQLGWDLDRLSVRRERRADPGCTARMTTHEAVVVDPANPPALETLEDAFDLVEGSALTIWQGGAQRLECMAALMDVLDEAIFLDIRSAPLEDGPCQVTWRGP
ncbi:MAG: hypothetical protein ACI8RZ_005014 [Myxococcota bacterium]|jgi:hypothetical protein